MRFRTCRSVAILLPLAGSLVFAQADFRETVTFGDSLTHNDLLWLVSGEPRALYGDDPMEAVFDKGAEPGDSLTNYAIAGSISRTIETQVNLYQLGVALGTREPATLIGFEIGGNDIINNRSLLKASPPGVDPEADALIDQVIGNIGRNLLELVDTDPRPQLVIWTIPDVSISPDHWESFDATELANIQAHTERVNERIRFLDRYPNVVVIDLYVEATDIALNPPVLFDRQLVPPPAVGEFDYLFADGLHPTAVANALFANGIIEAVNDRLGDTIPMYSDEELADLAQIPY